MHVSSGYANRLVVSSADSVHSILRFLSEADSIVLLAAEPETVLVDD